jgi:hypothetical protein
MADVIESIQTGTADAFLTLPFLIIGFSLFFGILTSNIGLLLLFFAQVILVPISSYLLNKKLTGDGYENIKYGLAVIFVAFSMYSEAFNSGGADGLAIGKYVLAPIFFIIHLFLLYSKEIPSSPNQCAVIPGLRPGESVYNFPSAWLSQITFFISFVFSNALLVYNLPTPNLSLSADAAQNAKRQANLDIRIRNRKALTIGIMILSILIFLGLLYFRFKLQPCENGFFASIPSIVFTGFLGSSFVNFLYNSCGINPIDILGIVQGMLDPDVMDKPVVCVGSAE